VPEKNLAHNFQDIYWITIISLLKIGIPWELIISASDDDMQHILATVQALGDYEQEVQERAANQQQNRMM
jgi:hypothetical protein